MAQVKLGFIGCGAHATRNLQPCLPLIPEIDFVATCDLDIEKAKNNAKRFGASRWYTDSGEMIASEDLDAVAIVGHPKTMHTNLAIACMESGKHIFIEKPPAVSVADTQWLRETSERTGTFGMVATMWRHAPAHRMTKQIIEKTEFGNPILFEGRYLAPTPRGARENLEWAFLLDQGVHIVDCMRYLMGDVAQLLAFEHFGENGRMAFTVSLQFVDSAVGTLTMVAGAAMVE
ncbi:MAG: Gfo/Idh/MocA family oxidoreductase, partial [Candidatus Poribacteria bacterium]|nr:Gfo/Idh/MocA family oxidoreductase [Candidatus Poribacteria bacterium]